MPCAICLCDYKDPRILPCGHSFCEDCIKSAVINYKLICPSCREKHKNIEVGLFPKNYGLIEEVDKRKDDIQTSSLHKSKMKKSKGKKSKTHKVDKQNNSNRLDPQVDEELSKAITKVHELKIRMAWFKPESNINRLIFTLVFIFLSLTVIAFAFLGSETQSDCREKAWIWHSIWTLHYILFIFWFIYYNNLSSKGKESSGILKKLYKILLIFICFWTIIIAFLMLSTCIPVNNQRIGILIIGGGEIAFNFTFCLINFLNSLKTYLNRKN